MELWTAELVKERCGLSKRIRNRAHSAARRLRNEWGCHTGAAQKSPFARRKRGSMLESGREIMDTLHSIIGINGLVVGSAGRADGDLRARFREAGYSASLSMLIRPVRVAVAPAATRIDVLAARDGFIFSDCRQPAPPQLA